METLCRLFGLTRQAYYKAEKRQERQEEKNQLILKKVRKIRKDLPGVGTRKLQYLTVSFRKRHGIKMGRVVPHRDKMYDLLRRENLLITCRKRYTRTTYSDHSYLRYKNLTEDLEVTAINQLYVSDITYIPIGTRYAYLNLVTDAYSRKIIGYHLHKSLHAEGTIKALEMALQQKGDVPLSHSPIHHSDRGVQYCCHDYIKLLKKDSIRISMTNTPDPLENALAERIHKTLKEEFKLECGFPTFEKAQKAVERVIFIYNHKYPHGSLGYLTPNQVHNGRKPGKKKWKRYPRRVNPSKIEEMVA